MSLLLIKLKHKFAWYVAYNSSDPQSPIFQSHYFYMHLYIAIQELAIRKYIPQYGAISKKISLYDALGIIETVNECRLYL